MKNSILYEKWEAQQDEIIVESPKPNGEKMAKSFYEVLNFNPNHDCKGSRKER